LCRTVYFNFQVHNPLPEPLPPSCPHSCWLGTHWRGVAQPIAVDPHRLLLRELSLDAEWFARMPIGGAKAPAIMYCIGDNRCTREVPDVTKDGGPVHGQRRHTDSAATLIPGMASPDQPSWAIAVHVVSSGATCCLGTLAEGRPYRCDSRAGCCSRPHCDSTWINRAPVCWRTFPGPIANPPSPNNTGPYGTGVPGVLQPSLGAIVGSVGHSLLLCTPDPYSEPDAM
jgi:hypothetical protein